MCECARRIFCAGGDLQSAGRESWAALRILIAVHSRPFPLFAAACLDANWSTTPSRIKSAVEWIWRFCVVRAPKNSVAVCRHFPLRLSRASRMEESRERAYKFVAYTAVSFSCIAVCSVAVMLPMLYNYVQSIHDRVDSDAVLCALSATQVPN